MISFEHGFHVLFTFQGDLGEFFSLAAPTKHYVLLSCFEGSLHDEAIVEVRISDVLNCHMSVDENRLMLALEVEIAQLDCRCDIWDKFIDEVCDGCVVELGVGFKEGANL